MWISFGWDDDDGDEENDDLEKKGIEDRKRNMHLHVLFEIILLFFTMMTKYY